MIRRRPRLPGVVVAVVIVILAFFNFGLKLSNDGLRGRPRMKRTEVTRRRSRLPGVHVVVVIVVVVVVVVVVADVFPRLQNKFGVICAEALRIEGSLDFQVGVAHLGKGGEHFPIGLVACVH